MDANEVYENFIGFEDRAAALYMELSVRFVANPELRWFWVDMAMEEKQHAGMLEYCREAGCFAGQLPDRPQVERLNTLYGNLEKRIGNPDLSVDEAFDVAIRLEGSEINNLFGRLTSAVEGPAHVMRKKIELTEAGHFEKLYRAALRFGVSADIQSRLKKLTGNGNW